MNQVRELVTLLRGMLADEATRSQRLREYHKRVWDYPEVFLNETVDTILRDLAYDLEFYERDPILREGDDALFGEDRFVAEVSTALVLLGNAGVRIEEDKRRRTQASERSRDAPEQDRE